jgi:hypothetical protein
MWKRCIARDIQRHCLVKNMLRIRIRSDPDLFGRIWIRTSGVWIGIRKRIRILAMINDPISTFLVCYECCRNPCWLTFWFTNIFFRTYFCKKNLQGKKLANKLFRSFSKVRSGSGKNRPDPQHWFKQMLYTVKSTTETTFSLNSLKHPQNYLKFDVYFVKQAKGLLF